MDIFNICSIVWDHHSRQSISVGLYHKYFAIIRQAELLCRRQKHYLLFYHDRIKGNAGYVPSYFMGRVLEIRDTTAMVTIPSFSLTGTSFTIAMFIFCRRHNKNALIFSNWKNPSDNAFSFLSSDGFATGRTMRVTFYPPVGIKLTLNGGNLADRRHQWQSVVMTWNRTNFEGCLYLNGKRVDRRFEYDQPKQRRGPIPKRYELGCKGDGPCHDFKGSCWFYGLMSTFKAIHFPFTQAMVTEFHSTGKI